MKLFLACSFFFFPRERGKKERLFSELASCVSSMEAGWREAAFFFIPTNIWPLINEGRLGRPKL